MSAGVCIINRNGIALAADSTGSYYNRKMFYNSSNKIFSLSNKYIYSAITYNNIYVQDVAVEQILKEFQVYLDNQECIESFFDILDSFRNFIKENNTYYKFDKSERNECISFIKSLIECWGGKIKTIIDKEDADIQIDIILEELNDYIRTHISAPNYDVSQHILTQYANDYEKLLANVIPEIQRYPHKKSDLWLAISKYFNLHLADEENNYTGILLAGYGQKDAFPKYIHIKLSKIIGGQVKLKIINQYEYDGKAIILPLAQKDVINTFCKGISQVFIDSISQNIEAMVNSKINMLPSTYTSSQKDEIENIFNDFKQKIIDSINTTAQEKYVDPILDIVSVIPLPEMACLAENLVNITALKRTYSIDGNQQTVASPIDVAIISKGDGFIWVKKKLYTSIHSQI